MNPAILLLILRAAEVIADPATRAGGSSVNDAIDALIVALQPHLPTKADGTTIARADVLALADTVDSHFQEIKDEMAKGTDA
jgi:hypothetical protein